MFDWVATLRRNGVDSVFAMQFGAEYRNLSQCDLDMMRSWFMLARFKLSR